MLKPLGDRVIIEVTEAAEETVGGILLATNAKEKPVTGKVVAVGSGYVLNDGTVRELTVKTGDEVLFDIQIDAMEGESLLLTRMARLLDVDFKLEDNQKLLLKDKTVSTFRIIAQKKDASLIRDFLTKEGAVYKHFPEVIA